MEAADDPSVREHRERITEADLAILAAVNRRIELVDSLHRHKRSQGYATVDADRERRLLAHLQEVNPGPLSDEALERLYRLLLELCTAEAARLSGGGGKRMTDVVSATDLTRRYGEGDAAVEALQGVYLGIPPGPVRGRHGAVRIRQVDAHAHPGRPRPADDGQVSIDGIEIDRAERQAS